MAWQTPKTDWNGHTNSSGVYTGDRFNAADFNRIKNNLEYLQEFAQSLYSSFDIVSLGEDRTTSDYFYADEINQLIENLETINSHTVNAAYTEFPVYAPNGNTMTFVELNQIESMSLEIYHKLHNQSDGRRMFTWNFGMKGGEF